MSPEVEKYYDTYFNLFLSDGWNQLLIDLKKINDQAIETTHTLTKSNEFFERKGNIHSYSYILNLKNIVEANYNAIKEDEERDEEDGIGVDKAEEIGEIEEEERERGRESKSGVVNA